ncbi:polyadenylate-binding protein 2, putative [Ichthyophthirius multifiliis]|uniref:Polyadenylate-binding protein 2, putative n=1 Tax=Ichthyophthirius multifiliis TaxID=5932 RepID=G0QNU8_ICHMU|nr:polyadenylate-binding protein 2, putative [Ichthyophthirius multifiliis]EGR33102.1 polyadenylate-binding protein 2, putative [Ichthyophthirius multifiliis]|eukprot:XP_004037088.1 polyadenylate-binding protein 2, putative [Ichthyophthirius multifiliis]
MQATVNQTTLYITNLQDGVTQEYVYKEFKKHGQIKSLKFFPKTKSAYVEYQMAQDAQDAKRHLNYIPILDKEINIQFYSDPSQRKNIKVHNLFIKNVPEELDQKHLHQFLTTFGEVFSLQLKKNDEGKNLGYGYVQFENAEARDRVLEQQDKDLGKLKVGKFEIILEKFSKFQQREHHNTTIHLRQFFSTEVQESEEQIKKQEIESNLQALTSQLFPNSKASIFVSYNSEKKNFWAQISFEDSTGKEESSIHLKLEKLKEQLLPQYPTLDIIVKQEIQQKELSEKNLICLGLKENINEQDFQQWIKDNIKDAKLIRVLVFKKRTPQNENQNNENSKKVYNENTQIAHVHFQTEQNGVDFLKFCADKTNKVIIDQIFETPKITLLLDQQSKKEFEKTKKAYEQDKKQLEESKKHIPDQKVQVANQPMGIAQFNSPLFFMNQLNQAMQKNLLMSQQQPQQSLNPNFGRPGPIPDNKHVQKPQGVPQAKQNQPARQQQQQQQQQGTFINKFELFLQQSTGNKQQQVEELSDYLLKNKEEFAKIEDEQKRTILGQIIFHKIQKLSLIKEQVGIVLKIENANDVQQRIELFQKENSKITGMLIDKDVFEIKDMLEFVEFNQELIERCDEAIQLIQNSQDQQTGQ